MPLEADFERTERQTKGDAAAILAGSADEQGWDEGKQLATVLAFIDFEAALDSLTYERFQGFLDERVEAELEPSEE